MSRDPCAFEKLVGLILKRYVIVITQNFGKHGFTESRGPQEHSVKDIKIFIFFYKFCFVYIRKILFFNVLEGWYGRRDFFILCIPCYVNLNLNLNMRKYFFIVVFNILITQPDSLIKNQAVLWGITGNAPSQQFYLQVPLSILKLTSRLYFL